MPRGHVEAGDHHEVGFAEVHPGLQSVRHCLQSLQILQGVHLEGLLQLDWAWWRQTERTSNSLQGHWMKSNEVGGKKRERRQRYWCFGGGSQPPGRHLSLSAEALKELDGFYCYMQSLVSLTYIPRSMCAAPASGAVWSVPALSSDTGTWPALRWFSAVGAPAGEAWC